MVDTFINLWLLHSFVVSKRRAHILIPFPRTTTEVTKVKFRMVLEGNKAAVLMTWRIPTRKAKCKTYLALSSPSYVISRQLAPLYTWYQTDNLFSFLKQWDTFTSLSPVHIYSFVPNFLRLQKFFIIYLLLFVTNQEDVNTNFSDQ